MARDTNAAKRRQRERASRHEQIRIHLERASTDLHAAELLVKIPDHKRRLKSIQRTIKRLHEIYGGIKH